MLFSLFNASFFPFLIISLFCEPSLLCSALFNLNCLYAAATDICLSLDSLQQTILTPTSRIGYLCIPGLRTAQASLRLLMPT